MAIHRRRRLLGVRIPEPELTPYGFGRAVETCSPVVGPNRKIQVCLTRPEKPGPPVRWARDVCRLLRSAVNADRESVYVLHLDTANRVVGIEEVARGTLDSVTTHPREVFKSAILTNAQAIILAHNHPSGNPQPSQADFDITERMADAGNLIGIPVRDHVVVGAEGCTSIRELKPNLGFKGAEHRRRRRR